MVAKAIFQLQWQSMKNKEMWYSVYNLWMKIILRARKYIFILFTLLQKNVSEPWLRIAMFFFFSLEIQDKCLQQTEVVCPLTSDRILIYRLPRRLYLYPGAGLQVVFVNNNRSWKINKMQYLWQRRWGCRITTWWLSWSTEVLVVKIALQMNCLISLFIPW